jgi:hypothetical protein
MFGLGALIDIGSELLKFATSRIGLPICVAAAVFLFYEGVPFLIDGRVDHEYSRGRSDVEAEARARAMVLVEKRNKDNAEITDMDAASLCSELGGRWVQSENRCD